MADKDILLKLGETIAARKGADAGTSYVASLMAKGEGAILRKVLEERELIPNVLSPVAVTSHGGITLPSSHGQDDNHETGPV